MYCRVHSICRIKCVRKITPRLGLQEICTHISLTKPTTSVKWGHCPPPRVMKRPEWDRSPPEPPVLSATGKVAQEPALKSLVWSIPSSTCTWAQGEPEHHPALAPCQYLLGTLLPREGTSSFRQTGRHDWQTWASVEPSLGTLSQLPAPCLGPESCQTFHQHTVNNPNTPACEPRCHSVHM